MSGLAGRPFITRDTDAIETPARLATVTTVGRRAPLLRVNVFMPAPKRYAGGSPASTLKDRPLSARHWRYHLTRILVRRLPVEDAATLRGKGKAQSARRRGREP